MKKPLPPMTIRLKKGNYEKLRRIMDKLMLHNPNQTVNYMIENWDYVEKWLVGVQRFNGFIEWLQNMKLELRYDEEKKAKKM